MVNTLRAQPPLAVYSNYSSFTAEISAGHLFRPSDISVPLAISPQESQHGPQLQLSIPEFDIGLGLPILTIQNARDYSTIIIEAYVDKAVTAKLTLNNDPVKNVDVPIRTRQASLNFHVSDDRARSFFFSESLYAMLSLAKRVELSLDNTNLGIGLHFETPLTDISSMMQRRQTYFGLLVIEAATGEEFEIPEFIPGEDMNSISFTYHAIIARHFVWLCNEAGQIMPATEETFNWFTSLPATEIEPGKFIYRMQFGPDPVTRTILGRTINLGDETVFLEQAVVKDRDEVLSELAMKDEHMVRVMFRPLDRKARYYLPNAPELSEELWDQSIENLINLESRLDELLIARYNELAASTLDLHERQSIGERPALDEDAYLMGDE